MAEGLFWLLFSWALVSRRPVIVYLYFGTIGFGAMSVLPPGLTGGITILPKTLCGVMLFLKIAVQPGGAAATWAAVTSTRRAGLLGAFLLVALIVTMFMPVLFRGQAQVVGLNSAMLEMLAPVSANLTQLAYLGTSIIAVIGICLWHQTADGRALLLRGVVLGAAMMVITGVLDVLTHGTALLAPFRTATYAMLVDQEILGSQRIAGLMPEASAYGGLCVAWLAALYFVGRGAGLHLRYPCRFFGGVAALMAMAAFSTASTAYLGLAAFAGVAGLDWLYRVFDGGSLAEQRRVFAEFAVVMLIVTVVVIIAVLHPATFEPVSRMVDTLLVKKTSSASFIERSMWNRVGVEAVAATSGLGVGVGSTRVSSWPIAVLSSTGILGAALMLAFILGSLRRRFAAEDAGFARGAKLALLVCLVPGAFAGTLVDFSPVVAVLFGLLAGMPAVSVPARVERAPSASPGQAAARAVAPPR